MVLKELISLWHAESPLGELFKRFDEMLITAKEMFFLSTSHLVGDKFDAELGNRIIKMDGKLNTLEQVIRRDIVTHISVSGTTDIIPCLQLISLVKDVERVGDYCKNIHEIASKYESLQSDPLISDLRDMRKKIMIWFDQTKRAFDRAEKDLATSTRSEAYLLEKECDRLVWSLAEESGGRNAVAIAMIIRFFKRVTAHLGNVCTSVTMPLDKLDYFKKPDGTIVEDDG